MKVWIVAKIYRGSHSYIHGLTEENQNLRLISEDSDIRQLPFDTGEVWNLNFKYPKLFLPHIENRVVDNWKFIGREPDMKSFLIERVKPWKGGLSQLFNGSLKVGMLPGIFIAEGMNVPSKSIGYWLPEEPLIYAPNEETFPAYRYSEHLIDYTGFSRAILTIRAQTLVHVSLKPWWSPPSPPYSYSETSLGYERIQKRSYLEIGGWYL